MYFSLKEMKNNFSTIYGESTLNKYYLGLLLLSKMIIFIFIVITFCISFSQLLFQCWIDTFVFFNIFICDVFVVVII